MSQEVKKKLGLHEHFVGIESRATHLLKSLSH